MSLTKNVWKLGETIPVHVECSVKGGSLEVDKVFLAIACFMDRYHKKIKFYQYLL